MLLYDVIIHFYALAKHPNANTISNIGKAKYVPIPTTNNPTNRIGNATIERRIPKSFNNPHVTTNVNFTNFHKIQTANNPRIISNILSPPKC